MARSRQETVPKTLRPLFEDLVGRTDAFCLAHLDEEYAQLCRKLTAALCRKRPSPLTQGRVETWACAIAYTIGSVNFLFDKSQVPHMSASDLCAWFGVSKSTASAKATQIRKVLKIRQFDTRWWRPSRMEENPMAWMIEVDGFLVDARRAPVAIQEEAFRRGFIPYLPAQKQAPTAPEAATAPPPETKLVGAQPPRFHFFLNPYGDERFEWCPRCEDATIRLTLPLVISIDNRRLLLNMRMLCRACPSCGLLITHQDELEQSMAGVLHEPAPEFIGKPYVVLGTIDESVWRRAMEEETSPGVTIANLHDFEERWHFERAPAR